MSQENVERLRAVYGEWAKGNFWTPEIFDPNVECIWDAGIPDVDVDRGLEALTRSIQTWLAAWDDFKIEAEHFVASGDKVLVVIMLRGRGRGSHVETVTQSAHVWTMRNGRAIRIEGYLDRDKALEAAGLGE
jgi:ketosteroid isomerase-like protein